MVGVVHLKIKKEEVKMPNYDKTGPDGSGALTGKRRGLCSGFIKKDSIKTENTENTENERPYGSGRRRGGQFRGKGFCGNRPRKNK
jgi:hypothetical protein